MRSDLLEDEVDTLVHEARDEGVLEHLELKEVDHLSQVQVQAQVQVQVQVGAGSLAGRGIMCMASCEALTASTAAS